MADEFENMSRDELMEMAGSDIDPNISRDELISIVRERSRSDDDIM